MNAPPESGAGRRTPAFTPGIELARRYWHEVVRPIVIDLLPSRPGAAALVGTGSEVLGFDTERSTDHGWGPKVIVFLHDDVDLTGGRRRELAAAVDARLADSFGGYDTRFAASTGAPARHQVSFTSVRAWFTEEVGFDPRRDPTSADWLAAPSQLLRSAVSGAVFEDNDGELTRARRLLQWYPDDVWLYLLGCQWRRIDQKEPFIGRAGEVGDEVGSAVVAARLVRDLMRLCFLVERQYAPYSKWLGTAFARLPCGSTLLPAFQRTLAAGHWREREAALIPAVESVARAFNALGVAEEQDPTARYFYDRPFRVLESSRFVDACMARTPLGTLGYAGGIDQFIDSTDILSYPSTARRAYELMTRGNGGGPDV